MQGRKISPLHFYKFPQNILSSSYTIMEHNLKITFEVTLELPDDVELSAVLDQLDITASVKDYPDAVVSETVVDIETDDDELPPDDEDEDEDSL